MHAILISLPKCNMEVHRHGSILIQKSKPRLNISTCNDPDAPHKGKHRHNIL